MFLDPQSSASLSMSSQLVAGCLCIPKTLGKCPSGASLQWGKVWEPGLAERGNPSAQIEQTLQALRCQANSPTGQLAWLLMSSQVPGQAHWVAEYVMLLINSLQILLERRGE